MNALLRCLLVLLACLTTAYASIPQKINYQGYLTTTTGVPVAGMAGITFRIYDVASGGTSLHSETQTVTAVNGVVNAIIGTPSLPLAFDVPYFLGITVASDPEMTPRLPLVSSPYAFRAGVADSVAPSATVAGTQITGTIGTAQIADSAVTQAKLSAGGAAAGQVLGTTGTNLQWQNASAGTVTSVGTGSGLTGGPISSSGTINLATTQLLPVSACASGQVAKWNGMAWACAADNDTNNTANDARYLKQGGNAFGATAVLGTVDAQAVEIMSNGIRVMRYEPGSVSPNAIGGSPANNVTAGVRGGTISGGGVAAGNTDPDFAGEDPNRVTDHYGVVGGGFGNVAGNDGGTTADAPFATVSGGLRNVARKAGATVAGGQANDANGEVATIGGGIINVASADFAVIAGGFLNEITIDGTTAAIGGGQFNRATAGFATVAGGDSNHASGNHATVAGGRTNDASGQRSTVSGGGDGTASGAGATVSGGGVICSANPCGVMTFSGNRATGTSATVPGGFGNVAGGDMSFAAGRQAKVRDAVSTGDFNGDEGTFIWADYTSADFTSTGPNQFLIRAGGGVAINTNQPILGADLTISSAKPTLVIKSTAGTSEAGRVWLMESTPTAADCSGGFVHYNGSSNTFHVGVNNSAPCDTTADINALQIFRNTGFIGLLATPSATNPLTVGNSTSNGNGAFLSPVGIWTNSSSRTFKEGFTPVDSREILEKVAALPIASWKYKGEHGVRHIGPIAEDFMATFGLGSDARYIGTVDADGVALAAIQGLHQAVAEKDRRVAALEARVARSDTERADLQQKLDVQAGRLNALERGALELASLKEQIVQLRNQLPLAVARQ